MPCYHPATGYLPRDGSKKLTFRKAEGYVDKPVKVSCGQCYGCLLERSRQWAVRCMHETQMSSDPISGIQHNSFITLTYDQVNLPDHASLEVEHWQLFAKRLRKNVGPFRYYHCGEYGEDTQRPHYHAVIWGQDFLRDRMLYKTSSGHKLYTSKTLDETWQKGKC